MSGSAAFVLPADIAAFCPMWEAVGSRVTCEPAPTDTDQDALCLVGDSQWDGMIDHLSEQGWQFDGNESYANALESGCGFRAYRHGELNLILTTDLDFYRRFSAASSIAKRFNLLDKADRIALFQAVIYGNPSP